MIAGQLEAANRLSARYSQAKGSDIFNLAIAFPIFDWKKLTLSVRSSRMSSTIDSMSARVSLLSRGVSIITLVGPLAGAEYREYTLCSDMGSYIRHAHFDRCIGECA